MNNSSMNQSFTSDQSKTSIVKIVREESGVSIPSAGKQHVVIEEEEESD